MDAPHPVTRAPQRARDSTRWDIQGLRAFAVLAVVLYHLWPNRLPGGFVGVDVFFVIPGFLITGHLVREQLGTGRIALASFWARRAKRLLPGAFLTILATGTAVLLVVPNALWGQYGRELIASTVYLQNWQLASDAVDYLAADNRPSPFQHFWSLSVEEQFYIALPVLLIVVGALLRRWRRATPVVVVRVLLGVVVVLSLTWSVVQTAQAPGVAYFSTATRAWEFALGGLAATVPLPRRHAVRVGGALAGVAALVASLWLITPSMPFPGVVALLPAAGATLVVLLGGRTVLELVGAFRPVAFTGRISYALYLWHWPAVVLLPIALGHPLGFRSKAVVLVGSFLLAAATTVLVEEPLRFSGWVRALRPRRVAVLGAVSTLVVVALGASTLVVLQVQQQQAVQFAQDLQRGDVPCFGAAALISAPKPCVNPALADVRVPRAAAIGQDDANAGRSDCWSNTTDDVNVCTVGPKEGTTEHLLAIGDSHNNALLDAYADYGNYNYEKYGSYGDYGNPPPQPTNYGSYGGYGTYKRALDWIKSKLE